MADVSSLPPSLPPATLASLSYLDCVNNVAHIGHSHPVLAQAALAQLQAINTNTRYVRRESFCCTLFSSPSLPPSLPPSLFRSLLSFPFVRLHHINNKITLFLRHRMTTSHSHILSTFSYPPSLRPSLHSSFPFLSLGTTTRAAPATPRSSLPSSHPNLTPSSSSTAVGKGGRGGGREDGKHGLEESTCLSLIT